MNKIVIRVMPESITGYVQIFEFDEENQTCTEERCGNSRDSFTVRDVENNFTLEDWNNRVNAFKKRMQELANDYPEYTFDVKEI